MLFGIRAQSFNHVRDLRILDTAALSRRGVMIDNCESQMRGRNSKPARCDFGKGMVRSLMHKMTIDPKQRYPVVAFQNLVRGPEFIQEGFGLRHDLACFAKS